MRACAFTSGTVRQMSRAHDLWVAHTAKKAVPGKGNGLFSQIVQAAGYLILQLPSLQSSVAMTGVAWNSTTCSVPLLSPSTMV